MNRVHSPYTGYIENINFLSLVGFDGSQHQDNYRLSVYPGIIGAIIEKIGNPA